MASESEGSTTNYGDSALQHAQAHAATLLEDLGYNVSSCVEPNVLVQLRGWLRSRTHSVHGSCVSDPERSPPRSSDAHSEPQELTTGFVRYYELMSDYFCSMSTEEMLAWQPLWVKLWGHVRCCCRDSVCSPHQNSPYTFVLMLLCAGSVRAAVRAVIL